MRGIELLDVSDSLRPRDRCYRRKDTVWRETAKLPRALSRASYNGFDRVCAGEAEGKLMEAGPSDQPALEIDRGGIPTTNRVAKINILPRIFILLSKMSEIGRLAQANMRRTNTKSRTQVRRS